jgi:glycerate dehydrogenase
MPRVAISLPLEEKWRPIIEEVLGQVAEVILLDEMPADRHPDEIRRADALLAWNLPAELDQRALAATAEAGFLQLMSAGADHLDFDALPDGLTICSNAGAYAEPMAECVLGLAIALARRFREEHDNLRDGAFNQRRINKSLRGATLGIVGYGGIGRAVADHFEVLDVEVMAVNTSGHTDDDVAWCGTLDELDHVLAESDLLILSLPLTRRTEGLIGADELQQMKSDAILINVARGEIIREEPLYEHLKTNPHFKAGLEAWWVEPFRHGEFRTETPILELPNVLGLPHNSAVVRGALAEGIRQAAENVRRRLEGRGVRGEVDPSVY